MSRQIRLALTVIVALVGSVGPTATLAGLSNRHNAFEPIFDSDGGDISIVTPGNNRASSLSTTRVQQQQQHQPAASSPGTRKPITTFVSQRKPTREIETNDHLPSFSRLSPIQPVVVDASIQNVAHATNAKRQFVDDQFDSVPTGKKFKKSESDDKHWSALTNYYQLLSKGQQQQQQQPRQHQEPQYPIPDFEGGISQYWPNKPSQINYNAPVVNQPSVPPFLFPHVTNKEVPIIAQQPYTIDGFGDVKGPARFVTQSARPFSLAPIYVGNSSANEPLPSPALLPRYPDRVVSSPDSALDWSTIAQLLYQQQRERKKSQEHVFDSILDPGSIKSFLREEDYCGYQNLAEVQTAQPALQTSSSSQEVLARLLAIKNDSRELARLTQTRYPSHMGVYNGTTPGDSNFLCGATWVHEKFALTVASCLVDQRDPSSLTVQAGEWQINRNNSDAAKQALKISRQVSKVHFFPRYARNSSDHNLALIEFAQPITQMDANFLVPACQAHPRGSLRTNACWTPVRNITKEDKFDPTGEGETIEVKTISMIEVPVNLIANDETQCQQQTKVEFFNFKNPNYICSGPYRAPSWRARLNQTDYFGSGIYCNEGGLFELVSLVHPIYPNSPSAWGYIDLSYYKPWIRKVTSSSI